MQQRTRGLLIAALFGLATLISACTQPPPQGPPRQTGEPAPAPAPAPPGAPSRVAAPALGVKVDNVAAARPPTGLAPAEVVYVEPVEGGFHPTAGVVRGAETPGGRSGAQRAGKRSAAARPVRPSRARLFRRCSGAF